MAKLKRSGHAADMTSVDNACKTILANIRYINVDNPVQTVMLTSATPNEGKSFVSAKLAEAMATSGKPTLLLECDLRRRTLANRLGIHPAGGLVGVLTRKEDLSSVVAPTHIPMLYFLDAEPGIPNPSDLLGSKRFKAFLDELKQEYAYIVIDTPPVGTFVDAAVISRIADASFLVVRENMVKREDVVHAYNQICNAGGRLKGVIMNGTKHRANDYYYYYYSKDGEKRTEHRHNQDKQAASAAAPYAPVRGGKHAAKH